MLLLQLLQLLLLSLCTGRILRDSLSCPGGGLLTNKCHVGIELRHTAVEHDLTGFLRRDPIGMCGIQLPHKLCAVSVRFFLAITVHPPLRIGSEFCCFSLFHKVPHHLSYAAREEHYDEDDKQTRNHGNERRVLHEEGNLAQER